MIKKVVALILCGAIGLTGWSLAQPPGDLPSDLPDPPLRLKKKGQEPKKVEPDPSKDPELKPEEKPKEKKPEDKLPGEDEPRLDDLPQLEDDDQLDELDDLVPPDEEEKEDILGRIARNTRRSEERLANKELGEGTKQVQKDIVDDLSKLIEQMQKDQKNNSGGGGGGGGGGQQASGGKQGGKAGGQGGQGGRSGRKGSRLSRTKGGGRNDQKQLTRNNPQQQPGQGKGKGNPTDPMGGGQGELGGKPKDPKDGHDLWGHLPEKERMLMNRYMREKFMQKYAELTNRYYRKLAEKSRK